VERLAAGVAQAPAFTDRGSSAMSAQPGEHGPWAIFRWLLLALALGQQGLRKARMRR